MRELTENEVCEVSGGIVPLVLGLIGINIALDGLLIAYAAYAANNFNNTCGYSK